MLARRVTLPHPPNQANSFVPMLLQPLKVSCLSFCSTLPLFSITCSLFLQNTRGGGCALPTTHSSRPTFRSLCFHNDTNPSSSQPAVASLYFHALTNPSTGNSFLFTSMQIPRGCGGAAIRRVRPSLSDAVRLRSTQPVEQYIEVTKHRQKECVMNPNLIGNYALDHLAECLYTLAARVFSTNLSIALANPSSSFVEVT